MNQEQKLFNFFIDKFSIIYPVSHALFRILEAVYLNKFLFQGRILDLGCGDGTFMKAILESKNIQDFSNQKLEIIGLEPNKKMASRAEKCGIYQQITLNPAHNSGFGANNFDLIFSNSVIEHLENLGASLKEINRITKINGFFLFSSPSNNFNNNLFYTRFLKKIHLKFLGKIYSRFLDRIFRHYQCYGQKDWRRILNKNGFEIIHFEYIISPFTLGLWDIFLPLSFPQHLFKIWCGRDMPLFFVNKLLLSFLVKISLQKEVQNDLGRNGSDIIILAQKRKNLKQ